MKHGHQKKRWQDKTAGSKEESPWDSEQKQLLGDKLVLLDQNLALNSDIAQNYKYVFCLHKVLYLIIKHHNKKYLITKTRLYNKKNMKIIPPKTESFQIKILIFLAHLSSAQDELLWSLFVRHPSVHASVR